MSDNSEDDNIQSNLRALPNSNEFSSNMMEILGALMQSKISLKLRQDALSRASITGTPIFTFGGNRIIRNENIYDITPERHKALSSTGYSSSRRMSRSGWRGAGGPHVLRCAIASRFEPRAERGPPPEPTALG